MQNVVRIPQNSEAQALERFGLRWAVLTAWLDDLRRRGVAVAPVAADRLAVARTKIASGCFSACEVGCDLAAVEAALVTADSSLPHTAVDEWLDRLGLAMSDGDTARQLTRIPAVRARYLECGFRGCVCEV
jgi:hypothetical protein